ncbi:hypothetical protein N9O82_01010 [Methylophilaceae bacterium]|nr:hypothetical protein [Methylophilaceae bacterium]
MRLVLTNNQFNPNPFWGKTILDDEVKPSNQLVEFFDQNGYDLTLLEQNYAEANHAKTTAHRNSEHITLRQTWFKDDAPKDSGAHINHAVMFERKGFTGDALLQLKQWAKQSPQLYKLIAMRPKWGLDFSIDYCDEQGNVFELLHWEFDGFDYQEIYNKKMYMEEFLITQDWDERAKIMLDQKEDWHSLGFFEQSEWKTHFFGIDKERFKMVLWK